MAPSSRTSSLRSSPLHTPRTSAAPPTIALPPCSLAPAPSPSTTELLYGEAPVESRSARRSKRKRARAHESSSSATSATTTHVGKTSSSCTTAATSTPRVADDVFSRVELFFNTSPSSPTTSSSTIFPRDISMLLMWSLPTSLPLIESPRRFLIKNKSRLRRVMMIYVNGWSYDKMMGTGAGLPRTTTTTTTDVKKDNDDDDEEEVWSERLCSAMLAPVRTQTCWARSGAGVQYAPLTLPNNMRVGLEEELMWMADLPRSANNNRHEQRNAASLQVQDEGLVDASRTTTSHDHARGVGSTFKRAMALVEEPASPDTPSCTPDASPTCASPTTQHVVPSTKVEEELAEKKVWENTTLLERFALRMPEHEGVLRDLGFIIDPAEYNNNNNAVGDDDVVVDAWSSFDPATNNNNNTSSSSPRVFAMDCEMVLVEGNESALARLTLVDLNQSCVVVDWLVQPTRPIIDYVTRFSGIDAEMLGPITTTLADCQAELKRWMNEESYLVGHSLENDLRACRMLPNCRILDSAWLFPHPSGLPFKNALRFLAKRYLHINIQRGSHDSAEDAIVSAQLVGLKMLRGDDFGRRRKVSVLEHMIHARIAEMRGGHEMDVGCEDAAEHPLKEVASAPPSLSVEEAKMRVQLFDEADTLVRLLPKDRQANRIIDVVGVRHDEDATRKVVRAWRQHQQPLQKNNTSKQNHGVVGQDDDDDDEGYIFMWVQLRDTAVDVVKPTSLTEEEQHLYETDQLERVAATNDRVMRMVESAPNNTLILILCAECGGESAGNHFSRAQGICFGFVKDDAARGPPPTTTDETPAPATTTGAPSSALDAPPPSSLATPPACQHQ